MNGAVLLGGRYQLRGLLGRDSLAEVRDGCDLRLSRPVAVRLLRPCLAVQPGNQLSFEAEARGRPH